MEDVYLIRDAETAKLLADRTRCRILALLRLGEFSASDLARALGLTPQAVSYHLRLLERAGLVKVVRTEVRRNLVEKYYRAVAKRFVVSYLVAESPEAARLAKEVLGELARGFRALGYDIDEERGAEILRRFLALKARALEEVLSRKREELPRGAWLLVELLVHVKLCSNPEFRRFVEDVKEALGGGLEPK